MGSFTETCLKFCYMKLFISLFLVLSLFTSYAQKGGRSIPKETSGNPIFPDWYADPEGIIFGHQYWVYPTYSDDFRESADRSDTFSQDQIKAQKNTINPQYLKQTFFNAFSSDDLFHWKNSSARSSSC